MDKVMKNEKIKKLGRHIQKEYLGILFVMPVILGLAIFTFTPMFKSLYDSFHDIDIFGKASNFGFQNYIKMVTDNKEEFFNSLWATVKYTVIAIPLTMVCSFLLALLLNREMPGIKLARVLCYVPVVIPTVVSGALWRTITTSEIGYFNLLFKAVGLPNYTFFEANETAFSSFIIMGLFGIGSGMILWLSQLKNIPKTLYESADLEGANGLQKLVCITIPMCTPTIFDTLITNIIGAFQVFDLAYMFHTPLNEKALDFFVLYIYEQAFGRFGQMGYASALSWVLFLIIAALSALVFKTSKWVYYGEDFN